MFVDFDSIFNDDPKSQFIIPEQYIDFLNKELPNGLKYVVNEDGTSIRITTDEKELKIGGIEFNLTKKQKEILGDKYTEKDVFDYAYNSQQKILIKKGFIIINGEKISTDKLNYSPFKKVKEKVYLIPQKLDTKMPITLKSEKYERTIWVSRVPNNSINILQFKSEKNEPLQINYTINNEEIQMNISYHLKMAKSITDIVESVNIYNAFIDGKGYIFNSLINIKMDAKKYDEKSILFWEKVLKLEKELDVKFNVPKRSLEDEEVFEIEELYQSLINKIPFKDENVINSINAEINFENERNINELVGNPFHLQFAQNFQTNILGKKIKLIAFIMVFNSKIAKVEKNTKNTTIILEDESETKKRFASIMCFKSQNELEEYKKQLNGEKMNKFKQAKSAYEYINEA